MTFDVTMDVALPIETNPSLETAIEQARRAEELGYSRVSLPEVTGWDGVALLAALAEHTESVGLSNDVFSPYSRSPALLGQAAVTLDSLSDGRYRLGLGTSSPALVENWHGRAFDRPLRAVRETVEIVRLVASGERVDYDGEVFDLGGLRLGCEPPASPPPIDVAGLGPTAVEMAGRFADGWIPQLFTPDGLRERMADFERGADLGGRDPADLRVALILRCCALEDGDRARELAEAYLAFMLGAYGPYYRQSVAGQGYRAETEAIHDAWEAGDREGATGAVTAELRDDLVAAGTPEEVRERVREFAAVDGLDAVRLGFLGRTSLDEQYATMEALAPDG